MEGSASIEPGTRRLWRSLRNWLPAGFLIIIVGAYLSADRLMEHAYRWTDENAYDIATDLLFLIFGVAFLSLVFVLAELVQRTLSWPSIIGYVFAFVLGLCAVLIDPSAIWHRNGRFTAVQNACINNLRLIDSAKQHWAEEYHKGPHDTPAASDLAPYLGRGANGELPACPTADLTNFEASYNVGAIAEKPTCKIAPNKHIIP